MIIKDRRNDAQKETHRYLVVGTDRFLSGWGIAEGGTSYAAWACESYSEAKAMEKVIRKRGDQKRVRIVHANNYRPKCKHLSIYVIEWKQMV